MAISEKELQKSVRFAGISSQAMYVRKVVPLFEQFGYELACKKFGKDFVDALPKYVRGPKKGQFKDWLVWFKITKGGWVKMGQSYQDGVLMGYAGFVAKPGKCFGFMTTSQENEMQKSEPINVGHIYYEEVEGGNGVVKEEPVVEEKIEEKPVNSLEKTQKKMLEMFSTFSIDDLKKMAFKLAKEKNLSEFAKEMNKTVLHELVNKMDFDEFDSFNEEYKKVKAEAE